MNKKEEFKNFVANHPNLVGVVKSGKHSWQDLFEVFDLYGTDESLWTKYLDNAEKVTIKEGGTSSIGELTKLFKNVNMDNVQKYIDTAQKAIGVIQELTKGTGAAAVASKVGPEAARPINKIFED